jgi:hypothetical protein
MRIRCDELEAEDASGGQEGRALQQCPAYGQAMRRLGARVLHLRAEVEGRVVAEALALQRAGLRVINRGPVWALPCDRRAVLRGLARWAGITVITPETPEAGFGLIPVLTGRHHAIWDLRGDLRAGMAGKWRNRLVAAERAGVAPTRGNRATLERLLAEEAGVRLARGYRALPPEFARVWPGDSHLWHWRQGGQVRAAMLFLRHGTRATYHLGWAAPEARAVFAHGPMLYQAALELRAAGVAQLDLGAVDADNPGLARFKLGTGAGVTPLGATLLVLPG